MTLSISASTMSRFQAEMDQHWQTMRKHRQHVECLARGDYDGSQADRALIKVLAMHLLTELVLRDTIVADPPEQEPKP